MEIAKIVKPFIKRGWPNTFGNIVYICRASSAILLRVLLLSDSFVTTILFSLDTFVFLKCMNLFILFGWICLSFIRFTCFAGQLWAKSWAHWVLRVFEWHPPPPPTDAISLKTYAITSESPVWRWMNAVSDAGNHTRSVNLSLVIHHTCF